MRENLKMQHNEPSIVEKFISVGSYITLGLIGMIWFIANFLVIKQPMSKFLMYNIIQSFILSIIYAIFITAYNIFIDILMAIPFIGGLFRFLNNLLFGTPVFSTMSLMNFLIFAFVIYLSIFPIFGKLPFVPFVTNMTKNLLS